MADRIKYPIGIQSFQSLREDGYAYVDKTQFVAELVNSGKYYFLSRPRRFGKSLFLSTLEAYFNGRRDLFKGLAIDSLDMDWTPRPVLKFDFNTGLYDEPDGLTIRLSTTLAEYERQYAVSIADKCSFPIRFENLIKGVYSVTGKKAVILVDEYDKPLLGIEENPKQFEKNQALLKGFFSNLKTMDEYIQFAFLTGVARFSKVSIFSDLNNLNDISMDEMYQEICGITEQELVTNFQPGISLLAEASEETPEETINKLRFYYDGYLFARKGARLYNPFSVLLALYKREIRPYWFETGTPTFLAKRVKASGIDPEKLNGQYCTPGGLMAVGLGTSNPVALMFQTGYLTIDSYDADEEMYKLRFPNREVEIGFADFLLPLYAPQTNEGDGTFRLFEFKRDLSKGEPEQFMRRLDSLLKDLPVEDQRESTYRAITYLLCVLTGTSAVAERHSYRGRSDLEVVTRRNVYIFEFKFNRSAEEAMAQLKDRDYAGRLACDERHLYLIGANFAEAKDRRSLSYIIEQVK